jgi:hypothetical protein
MQAPRDSAPMAAWPIGRRGQAQTALTNDWPRATTVQPTYSASALGTRASSRAVARAVDLIDVLADSRDEPLAPMVDAEPGPSPIGDGDATAATDVDALAQAVDLGGIDELLIPAGPALVAILDGSPVGGDVIAAVPVEPKGEVGGTLTEDDFKPSIPEPTALTLLALGAAMLVRRRRR